MTPCVLAGSVSIGLTRPHKTTARGTKFCWKVGYFIMSRSSVYLVSFLACVVTVKTSFQDIVFPPPILESNDPLSPAGHLKPLGWQRPADGPVIEYDQILSTQDYWDKHVKSRTPCVFRGAIKNSPAIQKWTDEYLKEKYGDLDVLVELKRENRTFSTGRMRYAEFIDRYKTDDLYVVTMLPKAMMHEIQAVNSVLCGTFKNFTHESNYWMSNGGTRSVIHYDADHNLHCMIAGRKDLIMVKNTQQNRKWLYMSAKPVTAGSGFSPLNPDVIDLKKHPNYAKVPWLYTTILPGDCVYIPAIYIHQVRAYGRSLSATTLFTEEIIDRKIHFTSEGCTDDLLKEYKTMADIDFHWTYEKGDQTIDMGYMNVERLRHIIVTNMKESRKRSWNFKSFRKFFLQFSHGEAQMDPEDVWRDILGHTMKDKMDNVTIKNYSREQMKRLARAFDPPHGPKTDGLEEVSVTPGSRDRDNDRHAHDENAGEERDGDERDGEERDGDERDGDDEEERDDEENDDEEEEKRRLRIRNGDEPADDIGYASLPDAVYDEEQSDTDDTKPDEAKQNAERSTEEKAKNDEGTVKEPKIVHGEL